jgi:anaerobic selenocysteine-containing dehydrogenase
LIKNNWCDFNFINKYVLGFEEFAKKVNEFSIERVSKITKIPEKYILVLAELIAKQSPMTIIPGYGMQRYTNGGQTIRSILALSVLTGNIGKEGACFHYANLQSYVFDDVKEPVNYYPSTINDFPFRRTISTAKLGIDMLATKNPELKMLWCERGNPVTQNPDTSNVLKAIRNLEFRVVVEQFMTDTAKEADVILPAKNMFEQSDIIGSYWNPYIQLKPKVVEPAGEVKPETEIYWHLAKRMNFSDKEIAENLLEPNNDAVEFFLKETIKKYPELNWEKLKEGPQLANNHQEIAFSDFKFPTPSGKIELFSEQAKSQWGIAELPDYVELVENERTSNFKFQLLTPNTKNRIHSQFGNLNVIKQFEPEAFAEINVKDAVEKNIADGDEIEVFNSRGSMRVKARLTFGIKQGCISISNGWWIENRGSLNSLSAPRETDIGHGTAFHDNRVDFKKVIKF